MKKAEFIIESKYAFSTERLNISVTNNSHRTIFTGYNKKTKFFSKNKSVVEAVCQVREDRAFIGHIESFAPGEGYGSELIAGIEQYYKDTGINKFYAYVSHNNASSKRMFAMMGYAEVVKKREGSFWEK